MQIHSNAIEMFKCCEKKKKQKKNVESEIEF